VDDVHREHSDTRSKTVSNETEVINTRKADAWDYYDLIEGSCSSHSWEQWEPKPDWTQEQYDHWFDEQDKGKNSYHITEVC
jgi:hypothetical protein